MPPPRSQPQPALQSGMVSFNQLNSLVNMNNSRNRVANMTEFIASVARELDHSAHTQLMLSSNMFFHTVGPVAWESVPRLDILLKLMRGTKVHFYKFEDSQGAHFELTEVTTTLSKRLYLKRFNIYAPWVQHLEIFGGAFTQDIENFETLYRLQERGPILPNLRRLTAYTGAEIKSFNFLWPIGFFIRPTLTEIRTILHEEGHPSYIEPSEVPAFLKLIHYRCPQIQVLELYPRERIVIFLTPENPHYESPGAKRFNIPGDEYRTTLATFRNLRSFTSTMYILQPETFSILGQLPLLETLGIRGAQGDPPVLDEGWTIPDTWFPKLNELLLMEVHPRDVLAFWRNSRIVKQLVSVLVHTDPTSPDDPSKDSPLDGNNWIETFLVSLPRLSPGVKDFQFVAEDDNWTTFKLTKKGYDALRKLQLESFMIENVKSEFSWDKLREPL